MKLLIIEDERILLEMLAENFRKAHYEVDICTEGFIADQLLEEQSYDLVILDLNLPGCGGMDILRRLRQRDIDTKVLILSARGNVKDKVEGLDAGANDYMSKPFHMEELEARVRSLTNRAFIQRNNILSCGALKLDRTARRCFADGTPLILTKKEFILLEYLLLNQGRPVSQEELIDHCWDNSVDSFSNSVRVHISSLRKKMRCVLGYDMITNKIGEGYVIRGI